MVKILIAIVVIVAVIALIAHRIYEIHDSKRRAHQIMKKRRRGTASTPSMSQKAYEARNWRLKSYEYSSLLRDLYDKVGNRAFQRRYLEEIQAKTGYSIGEIKGDLKRIRPVISQPQMQPQSRPTPSAPQKASTPVSKTPSSSTTQTPPIPPQSTPKQSAPSTPQKIATPIVNIPFDLRYLPDLTFYSHESSAVKTAKFQGNRNHKSG